MKCCLILLPSCKPPRKLVPIAHGDKCPRKPTFVGIEPSRTITRVESGSRKLLLLLDNYARKDVLNVEPRFLMTSVQKIRCPHTHNGFAVPTIAPSNLWWFGEQELLLLLLLICSPSFCEDPGQTFKTEQLFCKCVGLRLISFLTIGQKVSIQKISLFGYRWVSKLSWAGMCSKLFF